MVGSCREGSEDLSTTKKKKREKSLSMYFVLAFVVVEVGGWFANNDKFLSIYACFGFAAGWLWSPQDTEGTAG